MTTPFLTYELLTPETADPVVIRITGQRERGFESQKFGGIWIVSALFPSYGGYRLFLRGEFTTRDDDPIKIRLADWPAVKQAIRELNEHYKEKDMKHEKDEYEFPLDEWQYTTEPEPFEFPNPTKLILTRKKPKVEDRENTPVKVEWRAKDLNSALGRNETAHFEDYGCYRIVQFRVTGWDAEDSYEYYDEENRLLSLCRTTPESSYHNLFDRHDLYIGLDAREKWSAPVLLPESTYSRLDEITKALEDRANEVKG